MISGSGGEQAQESSVVEQVAESMIHHVTNSSLDHPLIHLPHIFGINMSVTKHVFMLWFVSVLVLLAVIIPVRRYLKQNKPIPTGFMNAIEAIVKFIRDSIVAPNVGSKWVMTWTPLMLTLFFFILFSNGIGMVPIFSLLGVLDRFILHTNPDSFIAGLLHGGSTVTGNFNVTAALATITFFTIILAGSKAHGFIQHWKNLVPKGLAWPIYIILIPIEVMGLFVKPFALTMRLAANMTGGHIALFAILSLMAIFAEIFNSSLAGIGVAFISVPMAVGVSALEIIVVMVQAYVFTLLTSVFVGMSINVHH